jgi:L-fucose isomerase-like protein
MCCHSMDRRTFLNSAAGLAAGMGLTPHAQAGDRQPAGGNAGIWDPDRPFEVHGKPLRVLPLLMYRVAQKKAASSWKSWGGVQTHDSASEEAGRIAGELGPLAARAGFPMEILPVRKVTSPEDAQQVRGIEHDVLVLYPATGSGELLRACLSAGNNPVIFVRHRSGPVYYWYEALSVRYLQRYGKSEPGDDTSAPSVSVEDVVVDEYPELQWRFRALYGVRNLVGARVIALGGAQGKYAPDAPEKARQRFKLDIVESGYDDLAKRIAAAKADRTRVSRAASWTDAYLSVPNTILVAERTFVVNAFLLYGIFKDLLREHSASIFTINSCMGTILPMAETTACLTLSLLNDEGLLAFCESDFVIIPAGILLHYVSGRPVFLHNSTYPHKGVVTCAHCTSPRRMDGARYEPARILTHYESEYGAAPKVEMPVGQTVTFVDPEYASGRWLGMKGTVEDNPFLEICRSQQDVRIHGDWKRLLNEVRDSHWVMAYGDHLEQTGYASRRIGVTWDSLV